MMKSPNHIIPIYLTLAIIVLVFLSSSDHSDSRRRHHRRMNHHRPIIHVDDEYEDDDAFNNVTRRIELLFPKIDVAPTDGLASAEELAEWIYGIAEKEVMFRSARDLDAHDRDKDGFVALDEVEMPQYMRRDNEDNTSSTYNMGWWRAEHFNASDIDGNGLLNLTEFNDFLHPADSKNSKLIQWLCKEEIRERDIDNDGKLSFQEFFHGLFDSLRYFDEVHNESDASETEHAKKLFQDLDKDNNGFLTQDELKPVLGIVRPSERYYAKQQANYVITQSDTDKDGHLSMEEMIEHPHVFYSSIFNEDEDFHDEFR